MCIKIYATRQESPGSCGACKPNPPSARSLSPQRMPLSTARGPAQFPGKTPMGYADLSVDEMRPAAHVELIPRHVPGSA